jgi:hypothetical protein
VLTCPLITKSAAAADEPVGTGEKNGPQSARRYRRTLAPSLLMIGVSSSFGGDEERSIDTQSIR